jgi:homoserine dehydrogenase
MKPFNVVILGCGTVGGGTAKIMLEMQKEISSRSGREIILKNIVELSAESSSKKFNLPKNIFCGNGKNITKEEANDFIEKTIASPEIDLIVETIGGSNEGILNIFLKTLKAKKHIVTANKALLAEHEKVIFETANQNNAIVGFEASVCGAIPTIKTIKESFTGDEIISISGIMNGTSNYILSKMQEENLTFQEALKLAQENGYAEKDPSFDIKGIDAGHKLIILVKLAFGVDLKIEQLGIKGIENITNDDIDFAKEMDSVIKLICFAERIDGKIYASVTPMMVKKDNFLSSINGATNALNFTNKYSGKHLLVGAGAGSLETASSIVSDIVFIAKYESSAKQNIVSNNLEFIDSKYFSFPHNIIFETEDLPGITGFVTTAIGNQNINIDTVSHNRHNKEKAVFSIATMPCTLKDINEVIKEIKAKRPEILIGEPKIIPILY